MRPALLLVDLQNDFLASTSLEPSAGEVTRGAARLLAGARALDLPVVHCLTTVDPDRDDRMPHWKARNLWMCVRGTAGHLPPPSLAPLPAERIVAKTYFSAFSSTALEGILTESRADALFVAGVHLHGCVRATVLDAYQRGLEVWVAEDAVGSDDPLHAAVTRRYLEVRAARFASVSELLARAAGGGTAAEEIAQLPRAVVSGVSVGGDGSSALVHASPRDLSRTLFRVPRAGAPEAERAAEAASAARGRWAAVPYAEKRASLARAADRLEASAGELERLLATDVGKPIALGRAEVARAAALLRLPAAAPAIRRTGPGSRARRVPLGVVAVVTPWNNPIAIPIGKIASALLLGNAVVWKPAPAASRIALRVEEILRGSGIPEGLVGLVCGDDRTARELFRCPGVDAVTLSGSSAAGWSAQEACAARRIPLQAELGGNNAAIVWDGADVGSAASLVAHGAFAFAGQRCTANRRAVVDSRLLGPFLQTLESATRALAWGDPLEPATVVGPLLSESARERVAVIVERALPQVEKALRPLGCGEPEGPWPKGAYYAPTVLVCRNPAREIVQEETFGPVLVVQPAGGFEEALELAQGVRQGLVASMFGGSEEERELFRGVRAGILKRGAATADADLVSPFGGWKASGVGPPERGDGDVEFYTRAQALYGETE